MRKSFVIVTLLGIGVVAVGLPLQVQAANPNPKVLPPGSKPYGKTYGEWGAAWQQWVIMTTTTNCPVTDTTGERALVGQSRPMYFLAGTFGEYLGTPWEARNPVMRDVTLPVGVGLCIPINNWGVVYPEDFPPGMSEEDAIVLGYEWLNANFDDMPESNLMCVVDGVAITNLRSYRSQSEPYQMYAPEDNVYSDISAYWGYPRYAEGWHTTLSDGYYVILAPLSVGVHTIHIRTGAADAPFCDVYYNLTITPDFDDDGDVDLADFASFQGCFNGPNRPLPRAGCEAADLDIDDDADLADFAAFQSCFNGPNRAPSCGNPNPRVLPPGSNPYGKSYGEWAAAWWQWAFSIPADINPLTDMTGVNAGQGQSGPVWFLGGVFGYGGTTTVQRTIDVPTGKALFFPIINYVWVNIEPLGDLPWSTPGQEAWSRALNAMKTTKVTGMACQIDGREVADITGYHTVTAQGKDYMIDFVEGNIWLIPAGLYGPTVDEGFYLMVPPLPAGEHTIHFAGTILAGTYYDPTTYPEQSAYYGPQGWAEFALDITYQITVR